MKMQKLGILIIGYKNVKGINRLLRSLDNVDFLGDEDIDLIFSIDFSGDSSVEQMANEYIWRYGEKHVQAYRENLGLRTHILKCGDYLETFHLDAMMVLEDDIYLSPLAYSYMKSAVNYYEGNPQIAGISLYKHEYNIYARHPFMDYMDGGDTFFVQYAMSWGQIWMKDAWGDFKEWYNNEAWTKMDTDRIPQNILGWNNSWLKYHIMYCIDKHKYFVYPRIALTTDFSDPGAHNQTRNTSMQIKLDMCLRREWHFNDLDNTTAIYDAFFENEHIKHYFKLDNLEVDLYGVKRYNQNSDYVLTRRELPYKVVRSWGLFLRPIEANIFSEIEGQDIFLYDMREKEDEKRAVDRQLSNRYFEYDLKGINLMTPMTVKYCAGKVIEHIKHRLRVK